MGIIKMIAISNKVVASSKIGQGYVPCKINKKHGIHRSDGIREKIPVLLANILLVMPAHAGKVFDFNATLPLMTAQFLLLMVFLDKTWFGPVGKILDKRDTMIRNRLTSAKSGYDELEALQNEAETILKEARADAQTKITEAKNKAASKAEAELATEKSKLDAELARAVSDLEATRASTQKDIEKQVADLSEYIVKKVLPPGFPL